MRLRHNQDQPRFHSEFTASLNYKTGLYLKKKTKQNKNCLRYDDKVTQERKRTDYLAAICQLFEFCGCQGIQVPSEYMTTDKHLTAFPGCCSFRQYMPKKLSKNSIKMYALVVQRHIILILELSHQVFIHVVVNQMML